MKARSPKILFLTLRVFSATGGIEKMCRIFGKALYDLSLKDHFNFTIGSMYDLQTDAAKNSYFPSENFRGFGLKKVSFIRSMVSAGRKSDTVILSHINLLLVGWLIKKLSPKTTIFLFAHGIEVWEPLAKRKKAMLQVCDGIICVSDYSRDKINKVQSVPIEKCFVLNNCLDPFLPIPSIFDKQESLLEKYGFKKDDCILMTLTRLSSKERYKGYDKVVEAMALLKDKYPNLKYLVCGKADEDEKKYLSQIITMHNLEKNIVMAGYIEDEQLEAHFALSDIYIMPSKGEGFGIVFLEAMFYGLPVVGGNIDGTTDALLNGELGQLVNPDDVSEIQQATKKIIQNKEAFMPNRELLLKNFSYTAYKHKLEALLEADRITG